MKNPYFIYLISILSLASWGCGTPTPDTVCESLLPDIPTLTEIASAQVSWVEAGVTQNDSGTWSDGSNGDITFGTISMVIAKSQNGEDTADLITANTFPICIPLGERSEQGGNATDTGTFVTDAMHTGMIAILGQENGEIVGRFQVVMGNASGEIRDLQEGLFRVPQR
jgi:hypothetical protein